MKYDNCKDCHSLCEHAGKDRNFVCPNGISCKIEKPKGEEKIIIIRGGDRGEEIRMVLRIKDYTSLCGSVIRNAIQTWETMSPDDPQWKSYPNYITHTLKQMGFEFEKANFDTIEDWDEG